MFARTATKLSLCLCVFCVALGAGAAVASALTYEGALVLSQARAQEKWGGAEHVQRCEGPFENVEYKTQWACYGYNADNCWTWQVNLDPYGHVTYATHGCPAVESSARSGAADGLAGLIVP
ncbi:MAG TPA: hypothetical protein VGY13_01075 [Solirubrobacteraceae bacterium]|jgi:hypothetical protein|nr:hypothetical protein [Solirubrobacteraceae bacterium]